jgi:glycosyltransferase involved in cell wall biosynthesis
MSEISIVIPTYRDNVKYLQGVLESLERNTTQDYEVIVVLNGPQKKSGKIAEAYGAKVLELPENRGYGGAMNEGFAIAKGDYIVGSNDDVLFTPQWDLALREVVDTFHQVHPYPKAGIVGPCTNFAGGAQHNPIPGLTPENLDDVAVRFRQENQGNWMCTGFISGFCFMVPRKIYDLLMKKDGFFFDEETFPLGGAEDNDLCVRIVRSGYSPVIVGTCYIYHYGSRTINKYFPELGHGINNLYYLYKKWQEDAKEQKILGALYRVKIDEEFMKEDWLLSLEKTYEFSDRIYILNNNSKIWPSEEELAPYQDKIVRVITKQKHTEQIESDDRQELYQAAYKDGCDWVISIDHDEIFEDKFDYEYAHRLMQSPQPMVNGFVFHWYHFWNDMGYWRSDGNRGEFQGLRMIRCLPNFYIPKREFHVGNVPQIPQHSFCLTSVRIKHTGQMRKEERERKFNWYDKNDLVKDPALIGAENYDHVKDETHAIIEPWIEDNSISLTTIMKDEEIGLNHYFNQYWSFADEIVLVDTGSTDRSVELAEMWGAKVIHQEWENDFSKARNVGLKECSMNWILHLDIDEDVPELGKVRRMTDFASEGWLFYVNNFMPDGNSALSETVRLMKNTGKWFYTGYVHETVDEAIKINKIKIHRATTGINHRGFLKAKHQMKDKLSNYLRMNLRQVQDYPDDARGYYNAAMHLLEAGFDDLGIDMLKTAMHYSQKFFQPVSELAQLRVNEAFELYSHLNTILPESHAMVPIFKDVMQKLEPLVQKKEPIEQTHVLEVLQEPEFSQFREKIQPNIGVM